MSTGLLAAGVLATEEGQRFLQIAEQLIDRGFWGLYHRHVEDGDDKGDLTMCQNYRRGLQRVPDWSEDILKDDLKSTLKNNPDFLDLLQRMYRRFHLERYPDAGAAVPKMHAEDWLRSFYVSAASSTRLRSGAFFRNADDTEKRRLQAADSMRSAFFGMLQLQPSTHSGAAPEEKEIYPDDSVSQIGGRAEERPPSVVLAKSTASVQSMMSQTPKPAQAPPPAVAAAPSMPPEAKRQSSMESIFQRHDM
jgi:hypothetical protein